MCYLHHIQHQIQEMEAFCKKWPHIDDHGLCYVTMDVDYILVGTPWVNDILDQVVDSMELSMWQVIITTIGWEVLMNGRQLLRLQMAFMSG